MQRYRGNLADSIVGIAGIFTIYTTADIVNFRRNQRRKIRDEVTARRSEILKQALQAEREGRASLRQQLFLRRYTAVTEAEEERISKRGFIRKAFDRIAPGIMSIQLEARVLAKLDDEMFEEMRQQEGAEAVKSDNVVQSQELADNAAGGPLDTAGAQLVESTKSWTSWLRWR
jgi:hypothetical protein